MAYIGKSPFGNAVRTRFFYTASGGETSLSGADSNGKTLSFTDGNYVDVYLNGVLLITGTDYNTSTENTIAGLSALTAGDNVEIVVYETFSLFNSTFNGNLIVNEDLTVDTNTLHVDSTNNRVGIGTGSPDRDLHVYSSGTDARIKIEAAGTNGEATLELFNDASAFTLRIDDDDTFRIRDTDGSGERDRLVIDGSGNVGIGTSSPEGTLHIENISNNSVIMDAPANRFNSIGFQTAGVDKWWLGRADSDQISGDAFFIGIDNGNATDAGGLSNKLVITQSGNVGIGTSSPSSAAGFDAKLQLESANPMLVYKETDQSTKWEVGAWGGNYVVFNGSSERMRINSSGNVGIGTTSPSAPLHVVGNSYVQSGTFYADAISAYSGSSISINAGSSHLAATVNGSERMRIDSSGRVGIGTSSVFSPLHLGSGESAPSTSGNMVSNGLTISNGVGGRAIQIGIDETAQGAYIQSGYVNNSNVANNLSFYSGANQSMTINSSGNVGIGTSSPDANSKLHIKKTGADAKITIETDESNDCYINFSGATSEASIGYEPTSNAIVFANAADGLTSNERMRIDISGQLGLGTSPPSAYWGTNNNIGLFTPLGYLGSNGNYAVSLYSNGYRNSSGGFTYLGINGNTSTASGIDLQPDANIIFRAGTASATALPERMRITSSGNVGLGTSSPSKKLHVVGSSFFDTYSNSTGSWETRKRTNLSLSSFASGANPTYDWNSSIYSFKFSNYNNCLAITVGGSVNNRQANIQVGHSSGDTYAQYYGSLYLNKLGGTVYANTSSISDERYKTNIVNIEEALNKINSLNGYTFYRTDVNTDLQQAGVIAQQVQEVLPCAVVYDEDEDKYAVSYDMLSALYIEAFKELKTKVENLEAQNAAILQRLETLEAN